MSQTVTSGFLSKKPLSSIVKRTKTPSKRLFTPVAAFLSFDQSHSPERNTASSQQFPVIKTTKRISMTKSHQNLNKQQTEKTFLLVPQTQQNFFKTAENLQKEEPAKDQYGEFKSKEYGEFKKSNQFFRLMKKKEMGFDPYATKRTKPGLYFYHGHNHKNYQIKPKETIRIGSKALSPSPWKAISAKRDRRMKLIIKNQRKLEAELSLDLKTRKTNLMLVPELSSVNLKEEKTDDWAKTENSHYLDRSYQKAKRTAALRQYKETKNKSLFLTSNFFAGALIQSPNPF